jgi:hypothetical protein
MAHAHGAPVSILYSTPIGRPIPRRRILDRYGKLLGPEELKELAKDDPNLPPPQAMARWAASFEAPHEDEGFSVVEEVPFVRRVDPQFTGKGLLLDVDGTLRRTKSGEIFPRDPLTSVCRAGAILAPGRRQIRALLRLESGVASRTVTRGAEARSRGRSI